MADWTSGLLVSLAANLLGEVGQSTLERLKERSLPRAIEQTRERFSTWMPDIGRALGVWVASEDFKACLEAFRAGTANSSGTGHVELFIRVSGFQLGTVRTEDAEEALTFFYARLRDEIYRSNEAIPVLAARQENLHAETREEIGQGRQQLGAQLDDIKAILLSPDRGTPSGDQAEAILHARIDQARDLVEQWMPTTALKQLAKIEQDVVGKAASPRVRFRIAANTAACLLMLDRLAEAREKYQEALGHQPDDAKVLANVAQVEILLGRPEIAAPFLERAQSLQPKDPHVAAIRIGCLRRLGKREELGRLVENEPWMLDEPSCLFALAQVAYEDDDHCRAEELLRLLVSKDRESALAWELLGRAIIVPVQVQLKTEPPLPWRVAPETAARIAEAESCFTNATLKLEDHEIKDDMARTLANRATARMLQQRLDDAMADAEEAYRLDEGLQSALRIQGIIHLAQGRPQRAVETFTQIADPELVREVALPLAAAYLDAKNPAAAERVIMSFWNQNIAAPDAVLYADLLLIALDRQEKKEAAEQLARSLRTAVSEHPEALRVLAQHEYRFGRMDRAISLLEQCVTRLEGAQRNLTRLALAEMYYRSQQFEQAAAEYEQLLDAPTKDEHSRRFVIALYNAGRLHKALQIARKVRGQEAAVPDFTEVEALVLEQLGDLEQAIQLRTALQAKGVAPHRQTVRIAHDLYRIPGRSGEARRKVQQVELHLIQDDDVALWETARLRKLLGLSEVLPFAYRLREIWSGPQV